MQRLAREANQTVEHGKQNRDQTLRSRRSHRSMQTASKTWIRLRVTDASDVAPYRPINRGSPLYEVSRTNYVCENLEKLR
jgi:hypothetical protein